MTDAKDATNEPVLKPRYTPPNGYKWIRGPGHPFGHCHALNWPAYIRGRYVCDCREDRLVKID